MVDGTEYEFGVSGRLYKSNILLYDRETESLWSQLKSEAVTGPLTGKTLITLPSTLTTWKKWRSVYPSTAVLSTDTGHRRDYKKDPYQRYHKNPLAFISFPLFKKGIGAKELILGVEAGGAFRAYPLEELRLLKKPLKDSFLNTEIRVSLDEPAGTITVTGEDGKRLASIITYWFVWESFHPESSVYKGP